MDQKAYIRLLERSTSRLLFVSKMTVTLSYKDVFKYIGDFGFYQLLLYLVVCLPALFIGLQNMSANFITAPMDHWCKISRLENFSFETQKYVAIPNREDEPTEYQSCKMYDLDYGNLTDDQILNWDRNVTANTSLIDCTEWIYDQSVFISTINSKYDLVCGRKWMSQLTTAVFMGGTLIGSLLSGAVSDKFGRKSPFLWSMGGYLIFSVVQAFAPNYTLFTVFRFFTSVCSMASCLTAYIIVMEILGPSHVVLLSMVYHLFTSVGFMLISGIAYFIRDHEKLLVVVALPSLCALPFKWLIPESPRWLVSQGKYKEAENILHKIAAVNRVVFPKEIAWNKKNDEDGRQEKGSWAEICHSRIMSIQLAVIYLNWFAVGLVYYGVSFNASAFGDVFANTFLFGLIEIPANLLCYIFWNTFGRRWSNGGTLLVTAAVELLLVPILLVLPGMSVLLTALSTLGKGAISFAFASIYLYTSELFPTPLRHLAIGSASVFARIGSMASPYFGSTLEEVWLPMPSVIFGILSALVGGLVLFLPETKGHTVPDTVKEAEHIGRIPRECSRLCDHR